jgi:two-component system, chemotaxis family, chemotaxis protein CheY
MTGEGERMKQILVVDDSSTIRSAIRRLLEPLGFDVAECASGEEALHYCDRVPGLSLMLLDIEMPGMDGIQVLRRLRADPARPQPRVVICSSRTSIHSIREALDAGADEYIMKPFDGEILASKLSAIGS